MKILFISPRFPYPPIGGDKLLVYNHIRLLATKFKRIYLLSLIEKKQEKDLAKVLEANFPNLTVETILLPIWRSWLNCLYGLFFSKLPLQIHYYHSRRFARRIKDLAERGSFDASYLHLIRMAQYIKEMPNLIKILSLTDCLTLRYERSAPHIHGIAGFIEMIERSRITQYETKVTNQVHASIVVTQSDLNKLRQHGAYGRIEVINNGVDFDYFYFDESIRYESKTISFLGNFHSIPNRDAVQFIAKQIWPQVRCKEPHAKLQIIGINPPKWILALDGRDGITVTGAVDDIRPYIRRSAATICPIRIGSGIQNKILESLALGIPVITTSIGFDGLNAKEGEGMLVADEAKSIANKIVSIMTQKDLRQKLSKKGRTFIEQHYDWEDRIHILYTLLKGNSLKVVHH